MERESKEDSATGKKEQLLARLPASSDAKPALREKRWRGKAKKKRPELGLMRLALWG